jgi:hypothetical protein
MRFAIQAGILICFVSFAPSCGRAVTGPGISDAAPFDEDDAAPIDEDDEDEAGDAAPASSLPADTPQLLMADSAHLAFVRASLGRGEPEFKGPLAALEVLAGTALAIEQLTVVDKEVTPPSGDKHDYMSQAPYYWPDPSKPDGKPYIRKDGQRNPEIDKMTDRTDIERLSRAVASLGLAFYFTGRDDYAQHAAHLVRGWFTDPSTRMNPNLKFGQGIPGRSEGRSAGIVETRFIPNILAGLQLLQGSSAWSASDERALKEWMGTYLKWLIESPLGRDEARRNNNHETWADVQISALALYTGQREVARKTLVDARADIGEAFKPDGRQPRELARTRPWHYSIFNLTAFMDLALIAERVEVDLWNHIPADGGGLQKGLDYLVPFATGEKSFPNPQLDKVRPAELHLVLRRAAVGWNEPRYRQIAQQIGGGTPQTDLILP